MTVIQKLSTITTGISKSGAAIQIHTAHDKKKPVTPDSTVSIREWDFFWLMIATTRTEHTKGPVPVSYEEPEPHLNYSCILLPDGVQANELRIVLSLTHIALHHYTPPPEIVGVSSPVGIVVLIHTSYKTM